MKDWTWKFLVPLGVVLFGAFFSWRLISIPSRVETAAFMILFFLIPTLKYPKFGVYYLFSLPFFIPMFRRMYYLVEARPTVGYLLLISDGVMGGFICALALLWLINKERAADKFPLLILAYVCVLFVKVFVGNAVSIKEGFYGFKFHGLYVLFFFAGSYIITSLAQTRRILGFVSWIMLFTAAYGVKQILFGFADFEQKWLDSITFTTLVIEGVVRPFSTYLSPATLADGMTILVLTGCFWIMARGRHTFLFGLLLIAAAIWPLLIATVRTNWLATAAGMGFYLGYLRIRKGWVKGALMAGVAGVIILSLTRGGGGGNQYQAAAALSSGDRSVSDIMIRNRTQALANPLQEYSVQKRIATWGWIWMMVMDKPFGNGQGTTGYAHSFYFQLLGECGFPGLGLFLVLLFLAFKRGFAVVARARDPGVVEVARYLLTLVFVVSILNLTGTHLHTPPGDLFFWFSLGTLHRFHREMVAAESAEAAAQIGPETAGEAAAGALAGPDVARPGEPLAPAGAPA